MLRLGRPLLWPTRLKPQTFAAGRAPKRWHTPRSSAHDEPGLGERQPRSLCTDAAHAHGKAAAVQHSLELLYPEPPSTQHCDLASFLDYARRTGLDDKSTVYVGTHYEYTVAAALSRYGFSLKRIGGASDHGTDLVGTWTLPPAAPARVLIQCKAGVQRVGPQHVRELEGAFVGAPAGWRGAGVLGVLVSARPATKGVRDSLGRSRWPMAYVCCAADGAVGQMLWNRRAEDQGLEGVGVAPRHVDGGRGMELVLLRNGELVR